MRAARHQHYGAPEVMEVCEMPLPEPQKGDVRIKVKATTVTAAETGMRQGKPMWGRVILGPFRPRRAMQIQGLEYAGVIDALGEGVNEFEVGQRVFGFLGFRPGACAEYVCAAADSSISPMPEGASFEEAAAVVDGASTALFFLKDRAGVAAGDKVLIVGAAGSVGGYAVQFATDMGAHVTGACSAGNADYVRSLGAEHVIDYTTQDFTTIARDFDVVFDAVGKTSFLKARRVLKPKGTYTSTTALGRNLLWSLVTRLSPRRRVRTGMSVDKRDSLAYIKGLVEQGKLSVHIDSTFALDQIVDAHRLVDSGRKRGNVVVTL